MLIRQRNGYVKLISLVVVLRQVMVRPERFTVTFDAPRYTFHIRTLLTPLHPQAHHLFLHSNHFTSRNRLPLKGIQGLAMRPPL